MKRTLLVLSLILPSMGCVSLPIQKSRTIAITFDEARTGPGPAAKAVDVEAQARELSQQYKLGLEAAKAAIREFGYELVQRACKMRLVPITLVTAENAEVTLRAIRLLTDEKVGAYIQDALEITPLPKQIDMGEGGGSMGTETKYYLTLLEDYAYLIRDHTQGIVEAAMATAGELKFTETIDVYWITKAILELGGIQRVKVFMKAAAKSLNVKSGEDVYWYGKALGEFSVARVEATWREIIENARRRAPGLTDFSGLGQDVYQRLQKEHIDNP